MTEQELNDQIERAMVKIHIHLALHIHQKIVARNHVNREADRLYRQWESILGQRPFEPKLFWQVADMIEGMRKTRND